MNRNLIWKMGTMMGGLLLLTGCGDTKIQNDMRNVEQRSYATIMVVENHMNGEPYHFVLGTAREKMVGEKSMEEKVSEWDAYDLEELANQYAAENGKDLSLAHLKIILLDEPVAVEKWKLEEWERQLFCMFDEEPEIAKTCPVVMLDEEPDFVTYLEDAKEPVGTYLENLVVAREKQNKDVPWVMDYLKSERENVSIKNVKLVHASEGWSMK